MAWRSELGSYLLITVVTALIWVWAAGETREERTIPSQVTILVPGNETWTIDPQVYAVSLQVEGSQTSIQNLQALAREGLAIEVTPDMAQQPQNVDLESAVRSLASLNETGVSLIGMDPPSAIVNIDRLVQIEVPVVPNLPGVQTVEAQPTVEPATVILTLPSRLQTQFGEPRVEAFMMQSASSLLPEGILQQKDVPLRIVPEQLADDEHVELSRSHVSMSFTIRSQTRELKLDRPVPIQLSGPWQDQNDYVVTIQTDGIRDVTITADANLIRRIEAGEATVVAILHLRSLDKERHSNLQNEDFVPTVYFMALQDHRVQQVQAQIGDTMDPPVIDFTVTHRSDAPAEAP